MHNNVNAFLSKQKIRTEPIFQSTQLNERRQNELLFLYRIIIYSPFKVMSATVSSSQKNWFRVGNDKLLTILKNRLQNSRQSPETTANFEKLAKKTQRFYRCFQVMEMLKLTSKKLHL